MLSQDLQSKLIDILKVPFRDLTERSRLLRRVVPDLMGHFDTTVDWEASPADFAEQVIGGVFDVTPAYLPPESHPILKLLDVPLLHRGADVRTQAVVEQLRQRVIWQLTHPESFSDPFERQPIGGERIGHVRQMPPPPSPNRAPSTPLPRRPQRRRRWAVMVVVIVLAGVVGVLGVPLIRQWGVGNSGAPTPRAALPTVAELPTLTPMPSRTRPPTQTPVATAAPTTSPTMTVSSEIVSDNADWTPIAATFNGVPMVYVPPNCAPDDDTPEGAFAVCVERGFWIDQTDVTRSQYDRCVAEGACRPIGANRFSQLGTQPINQATWYDADAYCDWRGARLATGEEWLYVAVGPSDQRYPWGDGGDASSSEGIVYARATTADVITEFDGIRGSWAGATDMIGNVWNWTDTRIADGTEGLNVAGQPFDVRRYPIPDPRNPISLCFGDSRLGSGIRCADDDPRDGLGAVPPFDERVLLASSCGR